VFLAGKVEDYPKKLKYIILHLHQVREDARVSTATINRHSAVMTSMRIMLIAYLLGLVSMTMGDDHCDDDSDDDGGVVIGQIFPEIRDRVLFIEKLLLQALSFNFIVEHPYQYLLQFIEQLSGM
jgi:hypothetical protein